MGAGTAFNTKEHHNHHRFRTSDRALVCLSRMVRVSLVASVALLVILGLLCPLPHQLAVGAGQIAVRGPARSGLRAAVPMTRRAGRGLQLRWVGGISTALATEATEMLTSGNGEGVAEGADQAAIASKESAGAGSSNVHGTTLAADRAPLEDSPDLLAASQPSSHPGTSEARTLGCKAREMFSHGYRAYMDRAWPSDELKPQTCAGGNEFFDFGDGLMLTLIDSLDSLFLMGELDEFHRACLRVVEGLRLDQDIVVSVFETNIRVLGGLLSAHTLMVMALVQQQTPSGGGEDATATCPASVSGANSAPGSDDEAAWLSCGSPSVSNRCLDRRRLSFMCDEARVPNSAAMRQPTGWGRAYQGELLHLARDLADRLMPAFATPTGIPYGSVNLRHGVPRAESKITCTACATTFTLEFGLLSELVGDGKYEAAARRAVKGVFARRSDIGLVGAHIDVQTGEWTHSDSGVGSYVDSYYEYLLKSYVLFGKSEDLHMFTESYRAVIRSVKNTVWYPEVSMFNGLVTWPVFSSLQAFFPGLQVMYGDVTLAAHTAKAFASIWTDIGALPERVNLLSGKVEDGHAHYPLRPELAESAFYLFQATGDRKWQDVGRNMLNAIQRHSRTACGFADIDSVDGMVQRDRMQSFFLGETMQYLHLLFDERHPLNSCSERWVFTTEGHILPVQAAQHSRNHLFRLKGPLAHNAPPPSAPGTASAADNTAGAPPAPGWWSKLQCEAPGAGVWYDVAPSSNGPSAHLFEYLVRGGNESTLREAAMHDSSMHVPTALLPEKLPCSTPPLEDPALPLPVRKPEGGVIDLFGRLLDVLKRLTGVKDSHASALERARALQAEHATDDAAPAVESQPRKVHSAQSQPVADNTDQDDVEQPTPTVDPNARAPGDDTPAAAPAAAPPASHVTSAATPDPSTRGWELGGSAAAVAGDARSSGTARYAEGVNNNTAALLGVDTRDFARTVQHAAENAHAAATRPVVSQEAEQARMQRPLHGPGVYEWTRSLRPPPRRPGSTELGASGSEQARGPTEAGVEAAIAADGSPTAPAAPSGPGSDGEAGTSTSPRWPRLGGADRHNPQLAARLASFQRDVHEALRLMTLHSGTARPVVDPGAFRPPPSASGSESVPQGAAASGAAATTTESQPTATADSDVTGVDHQ